MLKSKKFARLVSFVIVVVMLSSLIMMTAVSNAATDMQPIPYQGDFGKISVDAKSGQLVGENGKPAKLIGVNSHGLQWDLAEYLSPNSIRFIRDYWTINLVRANVYSYPGEDGWCLPDGQQARDRYFSLDGSVQDQVQTGASIKARIMRNLDTIITNCLANKMYVIIDWHTMKDNNPQYYKEEAKAFFKLVCDRYGSNPEFKNRVIFEVANEPNSRIENMGELSRWLSLKGMTPVENVTWKDHIKPYHEEMISYFRNNLKMDNIVICATSYWSQEFQEVDIGNNYKPIVGNANDVFAYPLDKAKYSNFMYSFHIYPRHDHDKHIPALQKAIDMKFPIFASEVGFTDVGGALDVETQFSSQFLDIFDKANISYVPWALPAESWFYQEEKRKKISAGLTDNGQKINEVNHLAILQTFDLSQKPGDPEGTQWKKILDFRQNFVTCNGGWKYNDLSNYGKFFIDRLLAGKRSLVGNGNGFNANNAVGNGFIGQDANGNSLTVPAVANIGAAIGAGYSDSKLPPSFDKFSQDLNNQLSGLNESKKKSALDSIKTYVSTLYSKLTTAMGI